ncbi:MAG TPA: STAS domain-containing protein [Solirubrobacterales bacterium]
MSDQRIATVRPFKLSERDLRPGCQEIEVQGELDLAVSDQLRDSLDRAAEDHGEILIDLEDCEFIDSTGIAAIVRADQEMSERGGRLALFAPSGQVLRLLSLIGLTNGGLVFDSLDEALAAGL